MAGQLVLETVAGKMASKFEPENEVLAASGALDYPELFAAAAPYNAPTAGEGILSFDTVAETIKSFGYELPYWVYIGDNDPVTDINVDNQLDIMLEVNHCEKIETTWEFLRCFRRPKGSRKVEYMMDKGPLTVLI